MEAGRLPALHIRAMHAPGATRPVIVMGVAGSGKSTLGAVLASVLGARFIEGDAFHPPENVERMRSGMPLTDADRAGWLAALAAELRAAEDGPVVLACSALKRSYRDLLRRGAPDARFVLLQAPMDVLARRLAERPGHFMPASLLASQLATLEAPLPDEDALLVDATQPVDALVGQVARWIEEREGR